MKSILISQNRFHDVQRNESRDGLDARLVSLIDGLDFAPRPMPNGLRRPDLFISETNPAGIILSGGNTIGDEPERDATEEALLSHALRSGIPVLGICRGMQMINLYLGGTLTHVSGHAGERHSVRGRITAFFDRDVNSYHDLAIEGLAAGLDVEASAPDGVIEAISHDNLPWFAMMWHPEREEKLAPEDLLLLTDLFRKGKINVARGTKR